MKTSMIWQSLDCLGLEHLNLTRTGDEIQITSTVLRSEDHLSAKIEYSLSLTPQWRVKQLSVKNSLHQELLQFSLDREGQWFDHNEMVLTHLQGAVDIDLSCTPFTNSLPINRLTWELNRLVDLEMVYIDVFNGTSKKVAQNYKMIERNENQQIFNYRSGTFQSNITVNKHGFVVDYPELFALRSI